MIKKIVIVVAVILFTAFSLNKKYKDGHYSGVSRSIYTQEPYYGRASIVIDKGKIVKVDFFIRDSVLRENFDGAYERHFAGNQLYIQQCRNDWKGVQSYPDSLIKHQDIDKVDAISGATWSYNIFKASVKNAMISAK